jgi:hypothetical protein
MHTSHSHLYLLAMKELYTLLWRTTEHFMHYITVSSLFSHQQPLEQKLSAKLFYPPNIPSLNKIQDIKIQKQLKNIWPLASVCMHTGIVWLQKKQKKKLSDFSPQAKYMITDVLNNTLEHTNVNKRNPHLNSPHMCLTPTQKENLHITESAVIITKSCVWIYCLWCESEMEQQDVYAAEHILYIKSWVLDSYCSM